MDVAQVAAVGGVGNYTSGSLWRARALTRDDHPRSVSCPSKRVHHSMRTNTRPIDERRAKKKPQRQ